MRDSQPLPSIDPKRLDHQARELDEYEVFCEALLNAYRYSPQDFAKNARKDITFAHMHGEPRRYRGQLVNVEGRLKRVRRHDAPETVRQAGLLEYYEGWIFDPKHLGAHPLCIVFTRLPDGVEVAEEMEHPVTFAGYFFKKYRYQATNGQTHDVPLVIGHAPVLLASPSPAAADVPEDWSKTMLYGVLGFIGVAIFAGIGLGWWHSRHDGAVRRRLADEAARRFAEEQEQ